MADNKQNQDEQQKNDRTNDAVGTPADTSNQRGNQNMEAKDDKKLSGGSDRVDTAGDANQGDSNKGQGQDANRQGNMQEKRPSSSNEQDQNKDREQQKRPA